MIERLISTEVHFGSGYTEHFDKQNFQLSTTVLWCNSSCIKFDLYIYFVNMTLLTKKFRHEVCGVSRIFGGYVIFHYLEVPRDQLDIVGVYLSNSSDGGGGVCRDVGG
jgi:hypothetical protein